MWKKLGKALWKFSKITILPILVEWAWKSFKRKNPKIAEIIAEVAHAVETGFPTAKPDVQEKIMIDRIRKKYPDVPYYVIKKGVQDYLKAKASSP
jgi:hypothetical protein